MGRREGEPDRAVPPEELAGVIGGLVMAEHAQSLRGREQRGGPQHEVERDHVAVQSPQLSVERHRAIQPHSREGKPRRVAKCAAVARTATKSHPARKSLSDFITERFDDFSRSQKDVARYIVDHLDEAAFQTAEELARRANTSSSTVVRFSQALGFDGYPELQQAAIEEYRHKVAEGAPSGNGGSGAAALFNFDHSEFESSLATDHANVEDTARTLTKEQVEACVSALASAHRVMLVGVDQMAFFASYLRHLLALLDIRAEVVTSPRQDSITRLSRVDEDQAMQLSSACSFNRSGSGRAQPCFWWQRRQRSR